MARITTVENKFLNELIKDCITFRLDESEAQEYIKTRFKEISLASYKRRKANVLSEGSIQVWLNNYTRIGFVSNHKQDIETISKIRDDSVHQLQIEISKPIRDENKILRIKENINETTKLLAELNLGTPIISAIKAKLQEQERKKRKRNDTEAIQVSQ
jgi:hypothetical protein